MYCKFPVVCFVKRKETLKPTLDIVLLAIFFLVTKELNGFLSIDDHCRI